MPARSIARFRIHVRRLVGLALACLAGVSAWTVVSERAETLDRAEARAAGFARMLAGHAASAFAESDRLLKDLLEDIREEGGTARMGARRLHDLLVEEADGVPQVGALFVTDREGNMLANSGEYPQRPIRVGDRDYFRRYLSDPGAGLTIGSPLVSRLVGRWRFNLMRPLARPGEPFDGIAAVAFETGYYRRFLDADTIGPNGRMMLVRDDGVPLVHMPHGEGVYGKDYRGTSRLFREMPPASPSGTLRVGRSGLDDSDRLVSYQRLSRFPVVAVVSLDQADVLASWRRKAYAHGIVVLAMACVILLLTRVLFQHLDRLADLQLRLAEHRDRQRQLEEQLRHIQKIEAVGQLAGGVAHDFNNLLTPILVEAEMASRSLSPGDPLRERMGGILAAAHKAKELTLKLLSVARRQMLALAPLDLNRVVSGFREILRRTIREDVAIDLEPAPGSLWIRGDQLHVEQVLLNLAVNAQDAIEGRGRIAIATGRVTIDEALARRNPGMRTGPHAFLSFRDDGRGMDEEVLSHVFEPFFTTKPVGQGTGLGLATVYGIVKQHEGYVRVASRPGEGTEVVVYFPSSGRAEEAGGDPRPEEPPPEPEGRDACDVLVVEDNEMVRSLIVGMLGTFGYRVVEAGSPGDALRAAADPGTRIDLLVTDVVMPEMNGRELSGRVRELRPGLPVLFVSGYTQDVAIPVGESEEGVRFLKKPFTVGEFLEAVRALRSGAGRGGA
jgi:signal transduction histidine kinase/CheY-like chemotaxis protein